MRTKLLIDEDLSPTVAIRLCDEGIDACHVRDRGLLGASDYGVLDKAFEEDRVLVTANVADFVKVAGQRALHAGIVLIQDGALRRDEQLRVVRAAVAHLQDIDMANRVLWVASDGSMDFEDIPPL